MRGVVFQSNRGVINLYTEPKSLAGAQIAIILNELGLEYHLHEINSSEGGSDPDHKTTTLTNVQSDGHKISLDDPQAIMQYLVKRYDDSYHISFPPDSVETEQVNHWVSTGIRHDHKKGGAGLKNFDYFWTLNQRLHETGGHLAGQKFSIADIAHIPIVVAGEAAGVDIEMFADVTSWYNKVVSRPAVRTGLAAVGLGEV